MPIDPSDPRLQKVAFAKLLGPDIEYYVKKYETVFGRPSKAPLDVTLSKLVLLSALNVCIL
jgi:hypothetical protein